MIFFEQCPAGYMANLTTVNLTQKKGKDFMSIDYIRRSYKVPAKVGGFVRCTRTGRIGKITGTRGPYLRIKMDDAKTARSFHPTWELEYIEKPATENTK